MNIKLCIIVVVAVLIRIFTFSGYSASPDEIQYVKDIQHVLRGTWPTNQGTPFETEFSLRIGYIAPAAGLVRLLGVSELSLVLYPLCCSILLIIVIYYLARLWVNEEEALWAAFLSAVFPMDVMFSTMVLVDLPLNFFCTLSVLLFFIAERKTSRGTGSFLSLLSGVVIGIAYLNKVTAGYVCVMFALIGIAHMIRDRSSVVRYSFLVLGFSVVLCCEMVFHYYVHHDPLYRLHFYVMHAQGHPELWTVYKGEEMTLVGALKRLFWVFPLHSLFSFRFGFFYWFIFPSIVYCVVRRHRDLWAPLFWWFLVAILANLTSMERLRFYARQTSVFSVPGFILCGAFLAQIHEWAVIYGQRSKKPFLILFGILALVSSAGTLAFLCLKKGIIVPLLLKMSMIRYQSIMDEELMKTFLSFHLWYMVCSAVCMAVFFVGVFLVAWNRKRSSKPWLANLLVVSMAGFLSISSVSLAYVANRGLGNCERHAYKVLDTLPKKSIYTDPFTQQKLALYFGSKGSARIIDFTDVAFGSIRDSYLVYNRLREGLERTLHDTFAAPTYSYPDIDSLVRKDWEVVSTLYNGMLVIYYIP